ncbi:hypothetical protein PVAND_014642 [Polypedilum vanderplanki]|uniref:Uncharacterized protein n=1 Tax=Polypedilum vanderplanki TaxID=319348 RepID=A0A9J6BAA1_POLVA|nr:hypothetical protein PVAND_014642 [Polypedilum vanderplanki]
MVKFILEFKTEASDLLTLHVKSFKKEQKRVLIKIKNNSMILNSLKYKFSSIKECNITPALVCNSVICKLSTVTNSMVYEYTSLIRENDLLIDTNPKRNKESQTDDSSVCYPRNGNIHINKPTSVIINNYYSLLPQQPKKFSIFDRLGGILKERESAYVLNSNSNKSGTKRVTFVEENEKPLTNKRRMTDANLKVEKQKLKSVVVKVIQNK